MTILLFRVVVFFLILGFCVRTWGDWKNWQKYYPTMLFIMAVNLGASFLTYHHALWNYSPDALIKTHTVLEFINCFFVLPAVTFLYLSKFPSNNTFHQFLYMALWVFIFSSIEFIDHYIIGGIYYTNGWSWLVSTAFDCAIFPILRLHHVNPLRAWAATFLLTAVIIIVFNIGSAEMK